MAITVEYESGDWCVYATRGGRQSKVSEHGTKKAAVRRAKSIADGESVVAFTKSGNREVIVRGGRRAGSRMPDGLDVL